MTKWGGKYFFYAGTTSSSGAIRDSARDSGWPRTMTEAARPAAGGTRFVIEP